MNLILFPAHDTDGILHEADQRIEYASNCEAQLSNFTVAQSNNALLRNELNIDESKLVCASGKFNAEACFVSLFGFESILFCIYLHIGMGMNGLVVGEN